MKAIGSKPSIIHRREDLDMSSKRIAQGIVALVFSAQVLGMAEAEAASVFSMAGVPATTLPGASFTVLLNADLGGDVLISLDPKVEFDATRLSFGGYEISGTLTDGFFVFDSLGDPVVSLFQAGGSSPLVQTALRARFDVLAQAPAGPASVRLRGFAGLDSLSDEVPFDFSSTVAVAAVPEPSSWLMLGIGLGLIGLMSRGRQSRGGVTVRKWCCG